MDYRKVFRLSQWIGIIGVIILVITRFVFINDVISTVSLIISVLMITAALILLYFFVKCPHCGGLLRFHRNQPPEYCPHCGEKME